MPEKPTPAAIRGRAVRGPATVATVAALTALLAGLLAGCGGSGSPSGGGSDTPTPTRTPTSAPPTTAERSAQPVVETYDKDATRIAVARGDRFALEVVDKRSAGYNWIIDDPAPDARIVRAEGERRESDGSGAVGSFATLLLDFRAKAPGSTEIRIRQCYRCGTEDEKVDAAHEETILTFHVTVRD